MAVVNFIAVQFKRWILVIVLSVVMLGAWIGGLHQYLTLEFFIGKREAIGDFVNQNFWSSLLVYLIGYATAVALSFPGASFLTIAGGFVFGWFLGGSVAIIGATTGASCIFLVARTSLGATFRQRAGPFLSRLGDGFRKNAISYLLFLRLTPVFPFWLVNIAPAFFGISLPVYIMTTIIGIVPGTYAFALIGSGLESVIQAQEMANPGCVQANSCQINAGALITQEVLMAFAGLGLMALLPVVIKQLRTRGTRETMDND